MQYEEEEEELPPIYIPDHPSRLYCGFYSQPDQFWLSMVHTHTKNQKDSDLCSYSVFPSNYYDRAARLGLGIFSCLISPTVVTQSVSPYTLLYALTLLLTYSPSRGGQRIEVQANLLRGTSEALSCQENTEKNVSEKSKLNRYQVQMC